MANNINQDQLNQINIEQNLNKPGKIGSCTHFETGEVEILFSVDEFDPYSYYVNLPLGAISNLSELQLVRKEIESFEEFNYGANTLIDFDNAERTYLRRYMFLNQKLREWQDNDTEALNEY